MIYISGILGRRLSVGPLLRSTWADGTPRWRVQQGLLFAVQRGRAKEWPSMYAADEGALAVLREVDDPGLEAEVSEAAARVSAARTALVEALNEEQAVLNRAAVRGRPAKLL